MADGTPGSELPPAQIKENEDSSEEVEANVEKPYKSSYGEIALDENPMVDKWIAYFQGRGRKYMEQYLARSTKYLPMMKNAMRENGLPEDLVYIALIESGFSPRAHSHANAVGYWQFIRSTGHRFGLQIDTFTDERRDPVLSTRAAAEYFKSLYSLFGSWHLSMAAYNVGEMRVKRAVTHYYTRDFWALVKKRRALPAETKQYVPKFIAAVLIAKNPEKYGFKDIEFEDPLSYDTVALQSPISLTKLANNIGVDVDELQLLNPKFRTDFVPTSRNGETVVRIPVGRGTDALAALSLSVTTQPKILQAEYTFYRIRRGDTLSTVARRHHTTVSQLRRLNGLSNRSMLRVGRSVKVPDNGGDGIQLVTEEDTRSPSSSAAVPAVETRDVQFHTVRRGENLTGIAQRYGLSVSDLLRLNGLSNRSILRRGQKLRIHEAPEKSVQATKAKRGNLALGQFGGGKSKAVVGKAKVVAGEQAALKRHVVRRGETLYDVSKRYGVSLTQLAKVNRLKINHRTMAGERLIIPMQARN
jgi:membrane-bound lytic murein transglycosylase D